MKLDEEFCSLYVDKKVFSDYSVRYSCQNQYWLQGKLHFFADFSLFVPLSTHIYIGRGNERVGQKVEDSEQR